MFRTAILTIAAAVSFAALATSAQAAKYDNGLTFNGRKANGVVLNGARLNGKKANGVEMNGRKANGAATAAEVFTFSAITLADGTKLDIVK